MLGQRRRRWSDIKPTLFSVSCMNSFPWSFEPILFTCWATVCDAGPTLKQHWLNAVCFLRCLWVTPTPPPSEGVVWNWCGVTYLMTCVSGVHSITLWSLYPVQRWNSVYKPWRPKGYFQFEIFSNILVSSFRFIWILMLWVYGHYKFLILSARFYTSESDICRRRILTSKDSPRSERVTSARRHIIDPGTQSILWNAVTSLGENKVI